MAKVAVGVAGVADVAGATGVAGVADVAGATGAEGAMKEDKVVVRAGSKFGLKGLDAFNVAVQLAECIFELGLTGSMRDQLTRASESVVLNISEAHPASGADRARRFQLALNELSEIRGGIVLLKIRRTISQAKYDELETLADRVGAMLYRLIHPR